MAHHDGDHAPHVEPRLPAGQATTEIEIVDVVGRQLRNLGESGRDRGGRQIVRSHVLERPLAGTSDGGAGGRDYHGFSHVVEHTYR